MKLVIVALLVPAIARAETESIKLADAIDLAIAQNPAIAARRIDVEIAGARVDAARGTTDFVFSTGARWDGVRTATGDTDAVTATASLVRPLPGGGAFALRSESTMTRTSSVPYTSTSIDDERSTLLLELRQPLLRGWDGETSPTIQIARTEVTRDIARLEGASAAAGLLRDVTVAYWEVAFARDELAIRRASLELAREQLRVTKARVAAGRISGSETLAVGQAIALREDEVAQAEVAIAARSTALARLLGREVRDRVSFAPSDRPRQVADRDLEHELAAALERSPELAALRARGRAATLEVEVTENGVLPSLDLVASAGVRGTGASASEVWERLEARDTKLYAAELQFSIPLGGPARGTRVAAKRAVRRVQLDERALVIEIEAAIVQATTALGSARRRIQILDGAVTLADQAITAERARWEEGKSNNYEVMKRQADRVDIELRRARAETDLVVAEANLDALTGAILPRYRVRLF